MENIATTMSQKHLSRKLCSLKSRSKSLQCFASVPAGEKVEWDGNNERASEKMVLDGNN